MKKEGDFETYYDMLGVDENADGMAIEEAFVKVLTDDELNIDPTQATTTESEAKLERSLQIIEAYNTLSHPSKRIDYDVKLR